MTRQAAHVFIVAATLLTRETIVTSLNKQNTTKWCPKILLKCEKTNKTFKLGATGESDFFKKALKL